MKQSVPRITGTFIDEITIDIPSANWSEDQWRRELCFMKFFGIDTLVIIRGGLHRRATFPSRVLGLTHESDFARLIFEEASKHDMKVYFGTYISSRSAAISQLDSWRNEYDINRAFVDEVLERYSSYPSFFGWYLSHEMGMYNETFVTFLHRLTEYLRSVTPDKPRLVSPYFMGQEVFPDRWLKPDAQAAQFDRIFDEVPGIDICAFQDATVPFGYQGEYFAAVLEVCKRHGVELWANVESFARDMLPKFLPADFRVLRDRLAASAPYVSKTITFEFSHFLSPQSMYPSARNLFFRYCEYFGLDPSSLGDI